MKQQRKTSREMLPEDVLRHLSIWSIDQSDILFSSRTDLDCKGEYAEGFVILTAKQVCIIHNAIKKEKVHIYRGYFGQPDSLPAKQDFQGCTYDITELERIYIEMGVGCNLLIAVMQGQEHCLTMFTNFHKKSISQLVRGIEEIRDGGTFCTPVKEDECCPKCGRMYPDSARKICPDCMDRRNIFLRVLEYFKPYVVQFVLMVGIIAAGSLLNLLWPYLNGTVLFDKILNQNEAFLEQAGVPAGKFVTALFLLVMTMVITRVFQAVFQILQGVLTAQMVVNVVRDMKKKVFQSMGRLSISFYRSRQTGGLMTRVMGDAERITDFFVDGAPYILINGFTILATLIVMFGISPLMAVMTIALFPFMVVVNVYFRPKIWIMYGRRHRAERSLNSGVNDNLTGARVVKSFGQENREIKRFSTNNRKLKDAEILISYRQNYLTLVYSGVQSLARMLIMAVGVYFIMTGMGKKMELGTLITMLAYVDQLQGPMNFFSRLHMRFAESMNSAQRIFEIIDAVPQVQESPNPIMLKNPCGDIRMDKVSFGYETSKPVLKNVSLHIPAGSMLGVVGRSGAGKTTLVNLISRMYDTDEGSIAIDGINVKELSFGELRKNVAMVSQETYIFMGTVAENIAYADRKADLFHIMQAAKLAGAHEFIMEMPDGYDTKIGASGRELSGGERQRISIARAILANPKILILDEATASVDTETEQIIQKSINYLVTGRTTISIAHRLSTLRDADYLVVIDHGEITEQGTHEELEALKGTYYKLMELQTKALAMKN